MSYYFVRELLYALYYYPVSSSENREELSENKNVDLLYRSAYAHAKKHHSPRMNKVSLETLIKRKECYVDNAKYLIELKTKS